MEGKIITSPDELAKTVNEFSIEKVKLLRGGFPNIFLTKYHHQMFKIQGKRSNSMKNFPEKQRGHRIASAIGELNTITCCQWR